MEPRDTVTLRVHEIGRGTEEKEGVKEARNKGEKRK